MSRRRLGLIAYEYPPLVGGMATYARAVARHMRDRGHEVHVFANERAQAEDGVIVHPVLTTDLARDLPRLAREKMDLWHAINFGYAPLALLKRPFVLTVHGTDFLTPWVRFTMDRLPLAWRAAGLVGSRPVRRVLYGAALRCVDQVLTCSHFSARLFRTEFPSAGPIDVVPNGVDERFLAPFGAPIARHPRRLLTVCNLDIANRRKNVDGVIRAMALVSEKLDLQYWIIGDGPERVALERLAREVGVSERVRFLRRVSAEELRRAYAASSLFVLVPRPVPGDVEGFGIVYLEAGACGTPSLGGRWGGAEDAIAEGVSGFFAEDATPGGIADALTTFFTGGVRIAASDCMQHAARLTWPIVLRGVEQVYDRLSPRAARSGIACSPTPQLTARRARRTALNWADWIRAQPRPVAPGAGGRVLLVSYEFPPVGGSGVQRAAKLARYLPEAGWTVEVLTAGHARFPWRDDTLLEDVPPDCVVHRVPGLEPACVAGAMAGLVPERVRSWVEDRIYWRLASLCRRLGLGQGHALWTMAAVQHARRRHAAAPFDAVITTGPPHLVHRVGLRIARALGVPWAADVRDPLVSDFERAGGNCSDERMRRLERTIMRRADLVVTTCPALAADLGRHYPQRRPGSIVSICNGFDREDLMSIRGERGDPERCVLAAAGAFYGRRELARIVEPLRRVLVRHPEWAGKVKLVIAGTLDGEQQRYWQQHRPAWMTLVGYQSHQDALQLLAGAACSIVVVPDCAHGRLSIPGKLFELLALPAHVLALVPQGGDSDAIIRAAGGATSVPFEETDAIEAAMERIIAAHLGGSGDTERDWSYVDHFERREVAGAFAQCLDAITGGIAENASHARGAPHLAIAEEVA